MRTLGGVHHDIGAAHRGDARIKLRQEPRVLRSRRGDALPGQDEAEQLEWKGSNVGSLEEQRSVGGGRSVLALDPASHFGPELAFGHGGAASAQAGLAHRAPVRVQLPRPDEAGELV